MRQHLWLGLRAPITNEYMYTLPIVGSAHITNCVLNTHHQSCVKHTSPIIWWAHVTNCTTSTHITYCAMSTDHNRMMSTHYHVRDHWPFQRYSVEKLQSKTSWWRGGNAFIPGSSFNLMLLSTMECFSFSLLNTGTRCNVLINTSSTSVMAD